MSSLLVCPNDLQKQLRLHAVYTTSERMPYGPCSPPPPRYCPFCEGTIDQFILLMPLPEQDVYYGLVLSLHLYKTYRYDRARFSSAQFYDNPLSLTAAVRNTFAPLALDLSISPYHV